MSFVYKYLQNMYVYETEYFIRHLAVDKCGNVNACLCCVCALVKKGRGFPYSLPSIGSGSDPDVPAVSCR